MSKKIVLAFTLAEVLITLAIIGVVAALTIPTVVQNYRKTQTITQLKKVYNALSNTTNLAIAEYGPIEGWDVDHSLFTSKYLIPFLKVQKDCSSTTDGDCRFEYKVLNRSTVYSMAYGDRFYLTDGTLILVFAGTSGLVTGSGTYYMTQAEIFVDLNGRKPPNTYGKDIFKFIYHINVPDIPGFSLFSSKSNGKFMPEGYNLSRDELTAKTGNYNYACSRNRLGYYCAALIMKDGWQMKDDYPW